MKICLLSGHEGSLSWQEMINHFSQNFKDFYIVKGLSDKNFRKSGKINRFLNRVYIFIFYPIKILILLKKIQKFEKIIVISSPFYLPLLVSILIERKKIIIFQNDIYPEGLKSIPFFRNKIFSNYFRKISDKYYSECLNIFISETLKMQRNYPNSKVLYTPSVKRKKNYSLLKTKNVSLGYLGTLGYYHFSEGFLKMLENSDFEIPLEIIFRVSGAKSNSFIEKSKKIKNKKNLKEFNISGSLNDNEFQKTMNILHYGLVLMDKNSSKINFPSKFPGHLSFGHPVVLISDQKNEIHDMIKENNVGISINIKENNLNALNDFFKENNYKRQSENSLKLFEMKFSSKKVSESLTEIISKYD